MDPSQAGAVGSRRSTPALEIRSSTSSHAPTTRDELAQPHPSTRHRAYTRRPRAAYTTKSLSAQAAIAGRRAGSDCQTSRRQRLSDVAQAAIVRRRAGSDCRTSRRQRLSDVAQAAIVRRRAGSDCQTSRSLRGAFDSLPVASPDQTLCHNLITSRLPPRPAFFAGPRPCPPVLRSPADPPQKHHCSCESRGDLNQLRTTDLTVSAAVISVDLARAVVVGR